MPKSVEKPCRARILGMKSPLWQGVWHLGVPVYDVNLCIILATVQGVLTAMAGAGAPVAVHLPHLHKGEKRSHLSDLANIN